MDKQVKLLDWTPFFVDSTTQLTLNTPCGIVAEPFRHPKRNHLMDFHPENEEADSKRVSFPQFFKQKVRF